MGYQQAVQGMHVSDFASFNEFIGARLALAERHGHALCEGEDNNGWPCFLSPLPGRKLCARHDPDVPLRVADRLTSEQLRQAAEMFARGATAIQVGEALDITQYQAQRLKNAPEFPKVQTVLPDPPNRHTEIILERVGIMKTGPNRWAELYG